MLEVCFKFFFMVNDCVKYFKVNKRLKLFDSKIKLLF